MKKTIFKVCVIAFVGCVWGCSRESPEAVSVRERTYASVEEEAKALALTVDEVKKLSKTVKDRRAAAMILSKYLTITSDSLGALNITKEAAKKLGVDEDLYEYHVKELNATNDYIKEMRKRGVKVDLSDLD